jgi:hypothetical protein
MMQKPDPSPIERQLEAHGRRRRHALGEPLALPRATQEALLAEVKRQYPPEPTPAERFSWLAWWPKLAWTGAIAGALLLVLAPLVQRTSSVAHMAGGRYGEMELAQAPAIQPAAPPAESIELAKKEKSARSLQDKPDLENKLRLEEERISAGSEVKLARQSAEAKSLTENPVAIAVPAPASAPTADTGVAMKRRFGLSPAAGLVATNSLVASNTALAMDSFAADKPLMAVASRASADTQLGTAVIVTNGFFAAHSNPTILNSFQFTQNGQEIQIKDEDGSVYAGQIVPRLEAGDASGARAKLANNTPTASPATVLPVSLHAVSGQLVDTNANISFYFRLAGTNLSLKQKVEIEGALANVESLNQTSGGQGGAGVQWAFSPTNPSPAAVENNARIIVAGQSNFDNKLNPNRWMFQNNLSPLNNRAQQNPNYLYGTQAKDRRQQIRLQGQAIVGGTNQVPIDAYPNSP